MDQGGRISMTIGRLLLTMIPVALFAMFIRSHPISFGEFWNGITMALDLLGITEESEWEGKRGSWGFVGFMLALIVVAAITGFSVVGFCAAWVSSGKRGDQ